LSDLRPPGGQRFSYNRAVAEDVMDEIRAFAPTGMLGSGYAEASLGKAMAWKPHFIGCDSGSTDPGPYYLGSGTSMFSRQAIKRDMRLILLAARRADIPLLIGSAGALGGAAQDDPA
jgi:hypothetical protein